MEPLTLADIWAFLQTQEGWWTILMVLAIVALGTSEHAWKRTRL